MRFVAAVLLLGALAIDRSVSFAQQPPPPNPTQPQVHRTTGARIGIGRSITVPADEEVSDSVVVVGGSARIDGRVRDGVVVVGGDLDLGPTADVRGEVVVVGGRLNRAEGSRIRGEVSEVSFGDWGRWSFGGWQVPTVSFGEFGRWMSVVGTTVRVSFLALMMLLFLVLARAPVARIGRAAAAEPGRAFLFGLLAEIAFIPFLVVASAGLVLTIVGIPLVALLVPAALLVGFVSLALGFTSATCRIGEWLEDRFGWRADSAVLATGLGLMLVVGPTIAGRLFGLAADSLWPVAMLLATVGLVLEFAVWTVGLGATLMTGFGRWSTVPPPVPPPTSAPIVAGTAGLQ